MSTSLLLHGEEDSTIVEYYITVCGLLMKEQAITEQKESSVIAEKTAPLPVTPVVPTLSARVVVPEPIEATNMPTIVPSLKREIDLVNITDYAVGHVEDDDYSQILNYITAQQWVFRQPVRNNSSDTEVVENKVDFDIESELCVQVETQVPSEFMEKEVGTFTNFETAEDFVVVTKEMVQEADIESPLLSNNPVLMESIVLKSSNVQVAENGIQLDADIISPMVPVVSIDAEMPTDEKLEKKDEEEIFEKLHGKEFVVAQLPEVTKETDVEILQGGTQPMEPASEDLKAEICQESIMEQVQQAVSETLTESRVEVQIVESEMAHEHLSQHCVEECQLPDELQVLEQSTLKKTEEHAEAERAEDQSFEDCNDTEILKGMYLHPELSLSEVDLSVQEIILSANSSETDTDQVIEQEVNDEPYDLIEDNKEEVLKFDIPGAYPKTEAIQPTSSSVTFLRSSSNSGGLFSFIKEKIARCDIM